MQSKQYAINQVSQPLRNSNPSLKISKKTGLFHIVNSFKIGYQLDMIKLMTLVQK